MKSLSALIVALLLSGCALIEEHVPPAGPQDSIFLDTIEGMAETLCSFGEGLEHRDEAEVSDCEET
jgi:hypothetical protein